MLDRCRWILFCRLCSAVVGIRAVDSNYSSGIFAFDWLPSFPRSEFRLFLMSKEAVVGSCLVLGFLMANLLSHRVARSTDLWLVEVRD